jgi:hypothetical protein
MAALSANGLPGDCESLAITPARWIQFSCVAFQH